MKDENGEDPGELTAAVPLADPRRFARRGSGMSPVPDRLPGFADVQEAPERLRGLIVRTPMLRHPLLDHCSRSNPAR